MPSRSTLTRLTGIAAGVGVAWLAAASARASLLTWGATVDETHAELAGDGLVPGADLVATRAVTIGREPDAVWPWLAQLGQGKGGFYSYDFLENLVGCDIHSADRIVSAWQAVDPGDEVRLFPDGGLRVAIADPSHALVLHGTVDTGTSDAGTSELPFDFSWAFVLRPTIDGTRLVVRERYRYAHRWVGLLVEPVAVVSFVMSRKMLHGIRSRAERVRA